MLLGNYTNRVSKKGRTAVPKRFRQELGKRLIITRGYEKTLMLVSEDEWQRLVKEVTNQPFIFGPARETDRFLLGNAFPVELDDQGRFVIPPALRQYAAIKDKAVFVGMGNRVEIWEEKAWQEHQGYLEENIAKISEKLSLEGR